MANPGLSELATTTRRFRSAAKLSPAPLKNNPPKMKVDPQFHKFRPPPVKGAHMFAGRRK